MGTKLYKDKWEKRLLLLRISSVAIVVLTLLSAAVILLTIYGRNVGNFVISADNGEIKLSLCETADFANPTSRLTAKGNGKQKDCTLDYIPMAKVQEDGSNNASDGSYLAYTFYLKNAEQITIGYNYAINILEATKGIDSALRVMLLIDGTQYIYAKAQEYPSVNAGKPENVPYNTIPFTSGSSVCNEAVSQFTAGQITKYTIVLWLEGYDAQCVDDIIGGQLKMEFKFTAFGI